MRNYSEVGGQKARVSEELRPVAIAVPLYREELTSEEEISLRHLEHFLGKYDKYLITPKSLRAHRQGFEKKRFKNDFFKSTRTYSALLLSKEFYETFSDYSYVLIYQLDALVFSDQLLEWCDAGYDYVGAPWLVGVNAPHVTAPTVGNGGFSLRKVESFLRVLNSTNYCVEPDIYWENFCAGKSKHVRYLNLPRRYLKRLKIFNGVEWEAARWTKGGWSSHGPNEDLFWSYEAVKYDPKFRIAPVEEAVRFAFEVSPRECFEMSNHTLPFGCHAWAKYDKEFWEPYLLR